MSNKDEILKTLNPKQQEAVQYTEGPLLVVAGPGSGKSKLLVHRTAYLIKVTKVNPRKVLAITFTNKAAKELRSRVHRFGGSEAKAVTIGTFHSVCVRLLRHEGKSLGLPTSFTIYDQGDQLALTKRCLTDIGVSTKLYSALEVHTLISGAKNQLISPQEMEATTYFETIVKKVYTRYQEELQLASAIDFDDMLFHVVTLFREHPRVLEKYQDLYQYIMVDEFQDTNVAQSEMLSLLGAKHRNVCVVGDPNQCVYAWRFADIRNILDFQTNYPDAHRVDLEQNYRSTKNILEAARNVIIHNKDRLDAKLWTDNEEGSKVVLSTHNNEVSEADYITTEVQRLIDDKIPLGEIGVLYRTNAQSRALESQCIKHKIPYQIIGNVRFYDRKEIKDIVAYLRVINNPHDSVSLSRILNVPSRGIGSASSAKLWQWAHERKCSLYDVVELTSSMVSSLTSVKHIRAFHGILTSLQRVNWQVSIPDLAVRVLEVTGYEEYIKSMESGPDRWNNILEFLGLTEEYRGEGPEAGLVTLLDRVALETNVDVIKDSDSLTLITLHQAKGLEYAAVFITGVEDGIMPHFRAKSTQPQLEEERRLCYVGMTRAKKRLYLSRAHTRMLAGVVSENPPSPFALDIPTRLVEVR